MQINSKAIYALGPNNVYFGGTGLYMWNGTTVVQLVAANNAYAIYAIDPSNVYYGGNSTLRLWNGSSVSNVLPAVNDYPLRFSVINQSNIFIGGQYTAIGGNTLCSRIAKMSIT